MLKSSRIGVIKMTTKKNTPINCPERKLLFILLLTFLLVTVFFVTLVAQNSVVVRLSTQRDEAQETEAIRSAAEDIGLAWKKRKR